MLLDPRTKRVLTQARETGSESDVREAVRELEAVGRALPTNELLDLFAVTELILELEALRLEPADAAGPLLRSSTEPYRTGPSGAPKEP